MNYEVSRKPSMNNTYRVGYGTVPMFCSFDQIVWNKHILTIMTAMSGYAQQGKSSDKVIWKRLKRDNATFMVLSDGIEIALRYTQSSGSLPKLYRCISANSLYKRLWRWWGIKTTTRQAYFFTIMVPSELSPAERKCWSTFFFTHFSSALLAALHSRLQDLLSLSLHHSSLQIDAACMYVGQPPMLIAWYALAAVLSHFVTWESLEAHDEDESWRDCVCSSPLSLLSLLLEGWRIARQSEAICFGVTHSSFGGDNIHSPLLPPLE